MQWLLTKDPDGRPRSAAEAWAALEEVAVAEMGPYWRRDAAITAPLPAEEPAGTPLEDDDLPTTEESPERAKRLPTTPTPLVDRVRAARADPAGG